MSDEIRPWSRPGEFKTKVDGLAGLVRVVFVGPPHDGHELFMDEMDLPEAIYTSGRPDAFEWWPVEVKDVMAQTAVGRDPDAPPVRYVLRVPDETGEPTFVADEKAR